MKNRRPIRAFLTAMVFMALVITGSVAAVYQLHYCEDFSKTAPDLPTICRIGTTDNPILGFLQLVLAIGFVLFVTLWTWFLLGKLLKPKESK